MGPEKWCKQKWGMMTVSQGAFFSAEWKSGCVLQLMAAGTEGVGPSGSERGEEGREWECCGNILQKYWTASSSFSQRTGATENGAVLLESDVSTKKGFAKQRRPTSAKTSRS